MAKAKNEFEEQINGISRSLEVYRFLPEKKAIWTVPVFNEHYLYCFSLRRSINSWRDRFIWN